MSSHNNSEFNDEFINIYANTDKRMQEIGQVLKTPKSRRIYQILMNKELHTKEIGIILDNDPNPRLPNLTHHLQKMTKIGMIKSTTRIKNGHYLTYYKAVKYLMIVPEADIDVACKSKTLKTTMKKVFKIASIGIATISSYLMIHTEFFPSKGIIFGEIGDSLEFTIPTLVLAGSIGIERMFNFFNKRRSIKIE